MDTSPWRNVLGLLWVATVTWLTPTCSGDSRCYCNAASCIHTGYMCKSPLGRCFSQLTYTEDAARSVHGCVESLASDARVACLAGPPGAPPGVGSGGGGRRHPQDWPLIVCCKDDMCNYMDNIDISIYVNTKSNGSGLTDLLPPTTGAEWSPGTLGGPPGASSGQGPGGEGPGGRDPRADVWFRAAVIAVPIAGGVILAILVVLAIRVLRADSRRQRRLVKLRRDHSLARAELYVADHFWDTALAARGRLVAGGECGVAGLVSGHRDHVVPAEQFCIITRPAQGLLYSSDQRPAAEKGHRMSEHCPTERGYLVSEHCPNEKGYLISEHCPTEKGYLVSEHCPNEKGYLISEHCPNEKGYLLSEHCPTEKGHFLSERCPTEKGYFVSGQCDVTSVPATGRLISVYCDVKGDSSRDSRSHDYCRAAPPPQRPACKANATQETFLCKGQHPKGLAVLKSGLFVAPPSLKPTTAKTKPGKLGYERMGSMRSEEGCSNALLAQADGVSGDPACERTA